MTCHAKYLARAQIWVLHKSIESDEMNHEEAAPVTDNFKGRCRGCGKPGHKKSDCPEEKQNNDKTKKFTSKCFHCGKKGHKNPECWESKRNDKANNVQEDDDGSEFALITWNQVIKVEYNTSDNDDFVNYIIDWRDRVVLDMDEYSEHDIIDFTESDDEASSFVKIDSNSWNKRIYRKDAELDSCDDSEASVTTKDSRSSNKYEALCCWCVDDDDSDDIESSIDENSHADDDDDSSSETIELTVRDEVQKYQEIDNILWYENRYS